MIASFFFCFEQQSFNRNRTIAAQDEPPRERATMATKGQATQIGLLSSPSHQPP